MPAVLNQDAPFLSLCGDRPTKFGWRTLAHDASSQIGKPSAYAWIDQCSVE